LVCLLRQNGIIPYYIVLVMFVFLSKFNKKIFVTLCSSVFSILIIVIPVYRIINVQPGPVGGKYIGL